MNVLRHLWTRRHGAIDAVAYWSGVGMAFEAATGSEGAVILMYHSVADADSERYVAPANRISPRLFERQMAFLQRSRRVVSLSALVDGLERGEAPLPRTVCITFDDGYLDNLTVAAPILERHGMEATLYLATGYVDSAEAQWSDALHAALSTRTRHHLRLPVLGVGSIDLRGGAGLEEARRLLHRHLLEALRDERSACLAEVVEQLVPEGRPPRLTLNWDDVRQLRRRYPFVELGGHTRDHVDLRRHGIALAREQAAASADDIRRETGETARHFSFPYGRWSAEARDDIAGSGWHSAVGAGLRVRIDTRSDRFAMPRVEAPRSMTGLRFRTSGAYPGVLKMLGLH